MQSGANAGVKRIQVSSGPRSPHPELVEGRANICVTYPILRQAQDE